MKSDVCKLTKDVSGLEALLTETEKAASYSGLDKKSSGRLRLLAEELVGMLPELLEFSNGEFWVESDGKKFELHTALLPDEAMTADKRDKILSVSTSGKNAAAKGIMNKIKRAAEFMLLDYQDAMQSGLMMYDDVFGFPDNQALDMAYANFWSLDQFRKKNEAEKDEVWDELERSIIANIADDVVVGVQGSKVEIIVKKQF